MSAPPEASLIVESATGMSGSDRADPRAKKIGWSAILPSLLISIRSDTISYMNTFLRSDEFDTWLAALKDNIGRARIALRIRSAEHGNFGDCEPVGDGVSEMRIHFGPGYRVYFTRRGEVLYLLLLGGNKSSQKRDIKRAIDMARDLGKE